MDFESMLSKIAEIQIDGELNADFSGINFTNNEKKIKRNFYFANIKKIHLSDRELNGGTIFAVNPLSENTSLIETFPKDNLDIIPHGVSGSLLHFADNFSCGANAVSRTYNPDELDSDGSLCSFKGNINIPLTIKTTGKSNVEESLEYLSDNSINLTSVGLQAVVPNLPDRFYRIVLSMFLCMEKIKSIPNEVSSIGDSYALKLIKNYFDGFNLNQGGEHKIFRKDDFSFEFSPIITVDSMKNNYTLQPSLSLYQKEKLLLLKALTSNNDGETPEEKVKRDVNFMYKNKTVRNLLGLKDLPDTEPYI